jgi:hypothetical protein
MSPGTGAAIVFIAISMAAWLLPMPPDRARFIEGDLPHNIWALHLWLIRFLFVLGIVMLLAQL